MGWHADAASTFEWWLDLLCYGAYAFVAWMLIVAWRRRETRHQVEIIPPEPNPKIYKFNGRR